MKYIREYETKITQKSLIEVITSFLRRALPNNFTVKIGQSTINIKDINIKKHNVGYFYVIGNITDNFEMHLACRTIEGSNINIVVKYIIDELRNNNIPISTRYVENSNYSFNQQCAVKFNSDYFEDIINVFNNLPSEDLNILMTANKFNL